MDAEEITDGGGGMVESQKDMDVCSTLTSITAIINIITFAMEFIFEKNNYVRRTSEECMWGGWWMDGSGQADVELN